MNSLAQLTDASLHSELKRLVGSTNTLTAQLLAHLAEVEARGIHRERACSSLYTYCVYELRMSEDEAQRRCRAARLARQFPILLDLVAEASLHLTGLLLIGPHLTEENHTELLARARFRTKREIERLIAEIAPCAELPSVVEPLYRAGAVGARTPASTRTENLIGETPRRCRRRATECSSRRTRAMSSCSKRRATCCNTSCPHETCSKCSAAHSSYWCRSFASGSMRPRGVRERPRPSPAKLGRLRR